MNIRDDDEMEPCSRKIMIALVVIMLAILFLFYIAIRRTLEPYLGRDRAQGYLVVLMAHLCHSVDW